MNRAARTKHGESRSREYGIWKLMRGRCRNPHNQDYRHYGGRGITICKRWATFENFLADMGRAPDGLTLDRIDNDDNYEPGNCRWATRREQRANQRRPVNFNSANGQKTHCKRGHLLAGENLSMYRGRRVCKACDVIRHQGVS